MARGAKKTTVTRSAKAKRAVKKPVDAKGPVARVTARATKSATAGLRLDRVRKPFEVRFADAAPHEVKQIAHIAVGGKEKKLDAEAHAIWALVSVVDVVDGATGKPRYDLYLLTYGDGVLFAHGTTRAVASISQHGFDPITMKLEEVRAFARAWKSDAKRLKLAAGHINLREEDVV